jgi:hypothetical protein
VPTKEKEDLPGVEVGFDSVPDRSKPGTLARLECCPKLEPDSSCSRLDFRYRLNHRVTVDLGKRGTHNVLVQVTVHAKLERCPGPLALGDLAYTTTLLPGEKVRLFTQDRRSRFTFDQASNVSYRHEQTAEESYYMAAMNRYMSDLSIQQSGQASASSHSSWDVETDTPGVLGTLWSGADVEVSGSHNAWSTQSFLSELRQHAESSSHRSVQATRTASAVSVGEVSTRTHTQSESESHFESSSRVFDNPNRCHAVTYLFYQLNKTQTIRFAIVAVERSVVDAAAPSRVAVVPPLLGRRLAVLPDAVRGAEQKRLDVEAMTRQSVQQIYAATPPAAVVQSAGVALPIAMSFSTVVGDATQPLDEEVRTKALEQIDQDLVKAHVLDRVGGSVSKEASLSFELHTSLPTPGLVVKTCLDECPACEPTRQKEILLDLQRKILENRLLARQIELLEKSQEYRCCPRDEEECDEGEGEAPARQRAGGHHSTARARSRR